MTEAQIIVGADFAAPPVPSTYWAALNLGRKTTPPKFHDREIGRHARHAAQIMAERGWTAGMLENPEGQVCAMGAMNKACSPMKLQLRNDFMAAFDGRFAAWLQENYPIPIPVKRGTAGWNDMVLRGDTLQWLQKFADAMDPQ